AVAFARAQDAFASDRDEPFVRRLLGRQQQEQPLHVAEIFGVELLDARPVEECRLAAFERLQPLRTQRFAHARGLFKPDALCPLHWLPGCPVTRLPGVRDARSTLDRVTG